MAAVSTTSLRPEEVDRRRQVLLNKFYSASGDAKAVPVAEHINELLDRGETLYSSWNGWVAELVGRWRRQSWKRR